MQIKSSPKKITILSNGYGEDRVGRVLAKEILEQNSKFQLQAYPLVDRGISYEGLAIPILGPRKIMPSGGLLLHDLKMFLSDIRAGFLQMTYKQLQDLKQLDTDILLVVGDVYALLLSQLITTKKRFYVQTLISAHHKHKKSSPNRFFMENYSFIERFLIKRTITKMYVRDVPTAEMLCKFGISRVFALGNPMLDDLSSDVLDMALTSPVIALLPGSRSYAVDSLHIMVESLKHFPEATGIIAWSREELPIIKGWQHSLDKSSNISIYSNQNQCIYLLKQFSAVLNSADLVLGTSGTAHEQAAALGMPIVAFPLFPWYKNSFLANQKRLLADALTIASSCPKDIAQKLKILWQNKELYKRASKMGKIRMGKAGGSLAIVENILR